MSQHDNSLNEIQHDIDQTRARIVDTLDALQAKLSPGQVLDHALGYAKAGGAEAAENLSRHVRENPLPAVLLGVSLAWLMKGSSRAPRPDQRLDRDLERAIDQGGDSVSAARERLSHGMERASQGVSRLGATARDGAENIRHGIRDATGKVQAGARELRDRSRQAMDSTTEMARGAADFAVQHPMVLGLIGLSIGAAIGAAALSTPGGQKAVDRTRKRIGDAAQDARDRVADMSEDVEDRMQRIKDAVSREADKRESEGVARSGDSSDAGGGPLPGESAVDKTGMTSAPSNPSERMPPSGGSGSDGRASGAHNSGEASPETRH